jgi:stalled ribosome alternative rescue factor ArfA
MHESYTIRIDQAAIVRRVIAAEKRDAMRSGVVQRAQTFRPKKGRGAYRRRTKHRSFT